MPAIDPVTNFGPARVCRYLGWEYRGHESLDLTAASTADTLLPVGVFPCADGYVSMMSTPKFVRSEKYNF